MSVIDMTKLPEQLCFVVRLVNGESLVVKNVDTYKCAALLKRVTAAVLESREFLLLFLIHYTIMKVM